MENKRSREDWKNEIKKYSKSGLSIKRYCNDNSISPSTFSYWKKKYDSSSSVKTTSLVKIPTTLCFEERMRLSFNQVAIEFPPELPADKIALLFSTLREVY